MRGKEICNLLKAFRKEIADKNGIDYIPHPCHYEGECEGFCPLCEHEANYILEELKRRVNDGLPINIGTDLLNKLEEYKYSLERIQTSKNKNHFVPIFILIDQSNLVDEKTAKFMEEDINGLLSVLRCDPYTLEIGKISILLFGKKVEFIEWLKNIDEIEHVIVASGKGVYDINVAWSVLQKTTFINKAQNEKDYQHYRPIVYLFSAGYDWKVFECMHTCLNRKFPPNFRVISYDTNLRKSPYVIPYQQFKGNETTIRTTGMIGTHCSNVNIPKLPPLQGEINIII